MSKRFSPYISVWVEYKGIINRDLDHKIETKGKKYGGDCSGSGCGFGIRDISVDFTDLKQARKFVLAMQYMKVKKEIETIISYLYLSEDD